MKHRWWALSAIALVVLGGVFVYRPVLDNQVTGDVYQMVQIANEGCHRPLELIAPIGEFIRPVSTLSLAFDLTVWRRNPAGFHLTTLMLHLATGLALLAAARALGISRVTSTIVAMLWVISPFTDENAVWAAIRHENTLLLAWLMLASFWPGPDGRWSRNRIVGVIVALFLAAGSKETWIATPFVIGALELVRCRFAWRSAVFWTAGSGMVAAAYVGARFVAFPSAGGYFEWSATPLAKVPHLLAAFFWLEELQPTVESVSWAGIAACVAVAAAGLATFRLRIGASVVGLALLLPPLGPTLFVPYLPQRYAAIPWAGFLLLAAGLGEHGFKLLRPEFRRWVAAGAVATAAALAVTSALMVRADLEDWERISDAHARLLAEARLIAGELPIDRPVAVIRLENTSPLTDIVAHPIGLQKLVYIRPQDPYGLIDTAALLEWVRDEDGLLVRNRDDWPVHFEGLPGRLLFHFNGGFEWSENEVEDLAAAAKEWADRGHHLQVVEFKRVDEDHQSGSFP